jgi:hypothetical protein
MEYLWHTPWKKTADDRKAELAKLLPERSGTKAAWDRSRVRAWFLEFPQIRAFRKSVHNLDQLTFHTNALAKAR